MPLPGERGAVQGLSGPWRWLPVFSSAHCPEAGASEAGLGPLQAPRDGRKRCGTGAPRTALKGVEKSGPASSRGCDGERGLRDPGSVSFACPRGAEHTQTSGCTHQKRAGHGQNSSFCVTHIRMNAFT